MKFKSVYLYDSEYQGHRIEASTFREALDYMRNSLSLRGRVRIKSNFHSGDSVSNNYKLDKSCYDFTLVGHTTF